MYAHKDVCHTEHFLKTFYLSQAARIINEMWQMILHV